MRSSAFSMLDFQFQDNISRNTNAYSKNLFSCSSLFQTTCCHLSFRFHLLQRPCLNPPLQKSLRFEHGLENCKSLLGSPRLSFETIPSELSRTSPRIKEAFLINAFAINRNVMKLLPQYLCQGRMVIHLQHSIPYSANMSLTLQ